MKRTKRERERAYSASTAAERDIVEEVTVGHGSEIEIEIDIAEQNRIFRERERERNGFGK